MQTAKLNDEALNLLMPRKYADPKKQILPETQQQQSGTGTGTPLLFQINEQR